MENPSVLYVGSGLSANRVADVIQKVDICCAVNNAWRVFAPNTLDYWLCPGDFPLENYPPKGHAKTQIGYYDYLHSAQNIFAKVGEQHSYPQHWAGYTTFFQGLYWLFDKIKPSKVLLLGFDHDYDQKKVTLWKEKGNPSPINGYCGEEPKDANAWASSFFKECAVDAIYGHGTPDPLRLGGASIVELFERAKHYANLLGIQVFNASGVTTGLNTFPQISL